VRYQVLVSHGYTTSATLICALDQQKIREKTRASGAINKFYWVIYMLMDTLASVLDQHLEISDAVVQNTLYSGWQRAVLVPGDIVVC
jgi:hypothetical protein